MSIKLEVGKKYVCRNRPDIKYVEVIYEGLIDGYPFLAVSFFEGNKGKNEVFNTEDGLDLIAEYCEPPKTKKIKVWVWDWYFIYGNTTTGTELYAHNYSPLPYKIPGTEREIEIPE